MKQKKRQRILDVFKAVTKRLQENIEDEEGFHNALLYFKYEMMHQLIITDIEGGTKMSPKFTGQPKKD